MSSSNNKTFSRKVEFVEQAVRRLTQFPDSLTQNESRVMQQTLILWLLLCYDILSGYGLSPEKDVLRWIGFIKGRSFRSVIESSKLGDEILLNLIVEDKLSSTKRFKHALRDTANCDPNVIFPWVYTLMDRYIKGNFEESVFKDLHQMLCFATRVTPNRDDPVLSQLAVEHFIDVDDRVKTIALPDKYSFYKKYLSGWKWNDSFEPFHSSGATADSLTCLSSKYRNLKHDALTHYAYTQCNWEDAFEHGVLSRVAKLQCVPKSVSKFRTISMEPTELQYLQHGYMTSLRRYLRFSPLRRRIDFENPDRNRDLAWEGSLDGSYSTIDLSDASDCVSWAQVKNDTFGLDLYKALLASRGRFIELPDGSMKELRKYAGMGNGLTFTLECLVFCQLAECAIQDLGDDVRDSRYVVYGDDIVIETKYVIHLVGLLMRYGFTVNTTKSFCQHGSQIFRESCGGEYLNGVDVTPVRLSRKFSGWDLTHTSSTWPQSLIELVNSLFETSPTIRRYVINILNSLPIHLRPLFDNDGQTGIFSVQPTNYRLKKSKIRRFKDTYTDNTNKKCWRWEYNDYQCDLLHHGQVKTKMKEIIDEDVRLYETLRLIKERMRLLYPEDRVDVCVSIVKEAGWSSAISPDHYRN